MVHDGGRGGEVWEPTKRKLCVCMCVIVYFFWGKISKYTIASFKFSNKFVNKNWSRTTVLKNCQNLEF